MSEDARRRAASLTIWRGPVEPVPLGAGITNLNFKVVDGGEVLRRPDRRRYPRARHPPRQPRSPRSRAAHRRRRRAGAGPCRARHPRHPLHRRQDLWRGGRARAEEPGAPPARHQAPPLRDAEAPPRQRADVLGLPFAARLFLAHGRREAPACGPDPAPYRQIIDELETEVDRVRIVFGHNDLLPTNFIDDGERIWLIDWEFAGFNSALFDLGGLASNNQLSVGQERWMLEAYYETPLGDRQWRRYGAMKCASLLREAVWSMTQEHHSALDIDYVAYTGENLARFERRLPGLEGDRMNAPPTRPASSSSAAASSAARPPITWPRTAGPTSSSWNAPSSPAARPGTPPVWSASCAPAPISPSC